MKVVVIVDLFSGSEVCDLHREFDSLTRLVVEPRLRDVQGWRSNVTCCISDLRVVLGTGTHDLGAQSTGSKDDEDDSDEGEHFLSRHGGCRYVNSIVNLR
jgi:hypothetical protein